jgi:hypothetical protein
MCSLFGKVQGNIGHQDLGQRVGSSANASFQGQLLETCRWTDVSYKLCSHEH